MSGPVTVTEVLPRTLDSWDPAAPEGRAALRARYTRTDPAYVRLNMITSVTGAASGSDGTSETLTSRVDRTILGIIRNDADVVVVGAQTVRAEGYVVPRSARLAIVTVSGDLRGHRLHIEEESDRVLIMCPASRADVVRDTVREPRIEVIPVPGDERMTPAALLGALAERGLSRVVCEGGPSLASQFSGAGVVDEYCLTVAPAIEPAEHPFLRVERRPDTTVAGMLVDDAGFSYLRLRTLAAAPAPGATTG